MSIYLSTSHTNIPPPPLCLCSGCRPTCNISSVLPCIFPGYGSAQYLLSMKAPDPSQLLYSLGKLSKNIGYQCTGPTLRNPGLIRPEQQSSHILVASENLPVKTQMLNSTLKVSNWEKEGLRGPKNL